MPGFPNTTSVTVSDVMATIDPAVGNVPKMYVWLVNIATNVRYGPSAATDSGGNWSIAAVPQGIYETFYAGESPAGVVPTLWTTAGAKGYLVSIALNPPSSLAAAVSTPAGGSTLSGGGLIGAAASPIQGVAALWGDSDFDVKSPQNPSGAAKGDGVTDDTAAFTALIAQCKGSLSTNPGGRKGTVPPGAYVCGPQLVQDGHGMWLEGQGENGSTYSTYLIWNGPAPLTNPSGALVLAQSGGSSAFTNNQVIHVTCSAKASSGLRTAIAADASITVTPAGNVITTSFDLSTITNAVGIRVFVGTGANPRGLCDIDAAGNITYLGGKVSGMAVGVAGTVLSLTISEVASGSGPLADSSNSTATFWTYDRTRDCRMDHFALVDGTNKFGIGIDIDQTSGGSVTSTKNRFNNVHVRNAVNAGVRLGHSRNGNTDSNIFDDLVVEGTVANGTIDGVLMEYSNSKLNRFWNPSLNHCTNGFHVSNTNGATGGSFKAYGLNCEQNAVDLVLDQPTDTAGVFGFYSENGGRLLSGAASGSGYNVSIEDGQWANGGLNGDFKAVSFLARGALNLIGVSFGTSNANLIISAPGGGPGNPGGALTCIGCNLPSQTAISGSATTVVGAILGCTYNDGSGHALPMANVLGPGAAAASIVSLGATIQDSSQIVALAGGTVTINPQAGTQIQAALSASTTIAFTANTAYAGMRLKIELTHDGTASVFTITWPATVKLAAGAFGTNKGGTNTANALDHLELEYDGTNWREQSRALALA